MATSNTVQLWDYWYLLRKRKLLILATMVVVMSIVAFVNMLQKPVYSSYTDLIVEVNNPTRILNTQTAQTLSQNTLDPVFFDTQAKLIQSSYFKGLVAEELFRNRNELPEAYQNAQVSQLLGLVQPIINVPSLMSARVMRITVENLDPKLAAYVVNTIAKVYIKYTQESQFDAARHTIVVLMNKLEQLTSASQVYGENHPIMIAMRQRKKDLEGSLLGKTDVADLHPQVASNSTKEDIQSDDITKSAAAFSPQTAEEIYQVLLKKLQELDVTRDVSAYTVRVIEQAKASSSPVRPNKRLNIMVGIVMGLVMGTGLGFFREYLDTTIKTAEELKNGFNLAVLGLIPSMDDKGPKQHIVPAALNKNKLVPIEKNEVKDELAFTVHRLASAEQLKAPVAEAYRTLRTNLQFVLVDRPIKTLLITSSIRGEGKTTTSVNLGIILAQTGKRVLIIDADLRRPRIHKAFKKGRDVGLTNLLLGESCLEDLVIPTDVNNLTILPSGPLPPNPAELVASERMKNLMRYAESKYDIVIFDSPPLVAVTDAALLATEVDGVLIIVEANALPRDLLKQGLERLDNVKAKVLGSVLNNVNLQKGSYYYYYYRYYHYDYASADKA
ncbi:MAG: polysaccharide biosynthesis tyrosine autokinase [Candidatus Omnitrophica bacterium]|nr:polysaccharide biosynthesis tyrosine autokinase [Candidatus Omnitrophota bacterium]MBU1870158.1 polysaccharide biosynthesis tyrosine autokinase [Candidatus Omnitrophota bacterium]